MKPKDKTIKLVTQNDLYYCKDCDIDNMGNRMCPCPRGGCEAKIIGTVEVKQEINIKIKK